nr:serine/threonine-protein kinase pakA-like [Ipomoea batatas]
MAGFMKPFQLLEINVMSAQDLEPVSKKMKTYATVCLNPTRRLTTAVDYDGRNNPTWNDKFVFRVDNEFLQRDTSAIQIQIYAVKWFRNSLVGSVRFLVGNLFPPPARGQRQNFGMRFVALQVRRKSGRPQGILNIGVALLDSSMRSMPLYRQMSSSAVGVRDLMQEDNLLHNANPNAVLRRMKSERSTLMSYDDVSVNNSSILAIPKTKNKAFAFDDKESSILSISFAPPPPPPAVIKGAGSSKKGKASSVINGAELRGDRSVQKGKASSVVSDSVFSKETNIKREEGGKVGGPALPPIKTSLGPKLRANSILSDSEVGPSPSEVAMAMARYPLEQEGSSVMDGWSVDESVEGLRSKLERWRAEAPAMYDQAGYATTSGSFRSGSYMGRQTDGGEAHQLAAAVFFNGSFDQQKWYERGVEVIKKERCCVGGRTFFRGIRSLLE